MQTPTPRKLMKSTIISEKAPRPRSDKSTHYVDNERFCKELTEYRAKCLADLAAGKPKPKPNNYIGECMLKICQRLGTTHHFAPHKYEFHDEMIDVAVENCIRKVEKFNPEVTQNPFSYFTQICYYSFLNSIEEADTHKYVKYKTLIDAFYNPEFVQAYNEAKDPEVGHGEFDLSSMEAFVLKFEEKMAARKAKEQQRKEAEASRDQDMSGTMFDGDTEE